MTSDRAKLLVAGYGSLLSGYGLLAERRGGASAIIADEAFPISIVNARRGLAKPSSHGRYLAMDLEPIDRSKAVSARAKAFGGENGLGALALVFDRKWIGAIAQREEYRGDKLGEIVQLADR